jgi:L-alanine-DL-glutamate epimerase-like enolase superfamily enzyme
MARLSKAGVPVMATEAEYRPELHEKLTHDAQVAFLQTAPIACGGISRVMALSEMVGGTPTRLSLEVSSTAVALMAACQIAAADPMIAHVEHHSVHTVFFDTLRLQKQANNRHSLPDEPGLGITLPSTDISTAYSTGDDHIAQLPRQAVTTI